MALWHYAEGLFTARKNHVENILLVEDKAELREMLTHALTRMGFQAVGAANLEQALAELRSQRFSAVLTDLKLPTGSGLNVLEVALEQDPHVPVVIMTAHGTIPMRSRRCDKGPSISSRSRSTSPISSTC
jgi:DNA-binding NtrC family response regulator